MSSWLSILISVALFSLKASAADTAVATLNISGDVPTIFSMTARGVPGDLDLSPGVVVNNRLLGIIHLKYNVSVASLTVASSTASGVPENGSAVAYSFAAGNAFKVAFTAAGCTSVAAANNAPFALTAGGTDIKSAAAASLTAGVEEDCSLTATWGGTSSSIPLSGKYNLVISLTMISI